MDRRLRHRSPGRTPGASDPFWDSPFGKSDGYLGVVSTAAEMAQTTNAEAWTVVFATRITQARFGDGAVHDVARYRLVSNPTRRAKVMVQVTVVSGAPTQIELTLDGAGNGGLNPVVTTSRSLSSWGDAICVIVQHDAAATGAKGITGNSAGASSFSGVVDGGVMSAGFPSSSPFGAGFFGDFDSLNPDWQFESLADSSDWVMQTYYDAQHLTDAEVLAKIALLDPSMDPAVYVGAP